MPFFNFNTNRYYLGFVKPLFSAELQHSEFKRFVHNSVFTSANLHFLPCNTFIVSIYSTIHAFQTSGQSLLHTIYYNKINFYSLKKSWYVYPKRNILILVWIAFFSWVFLIFISLFNTYRIAFCYFREIKNKGFKIIFDFYQT